MDTPTQKPLTSPELLKAEIKEQIKTEAIRLAEKHNKKKMLRYTCFISVIIAIGIFSLWLPIGLPKSYSDVHWALNTIIMILALSIALLLLSMIIYDHMIEDRLAKRPQQLLTYIIEVIAEKRSLFATKKNKFLEIETDYDDLVAKYKMLLMYLEHGKSDRTIGTLYGTTIFETFQPILCSQAEIICNFFHHKLFQEGPFQDWPSPPAYNLPKSLQANIKDSIIQTWLKSGTRNQQKFQGILKKLDDRTSKIKNESSAWIKEREELLSDLHWQAKENLYNGAFDHNFEF